jgi:hypothetical protein
MSDTATADPKIQEYFEALKARALHFEAEVVYLRRVLSNVQAAVAALEANPKPGPKDDPFAFYRTHEKYRWYAEGHDDYDHYVNECDECRKVIAKPMRDALDDIIPPDAET